MKDGLGKIENGNKWRKMGKKEGKKRYGLGISSLGLRTLIGMMNAAFIYCGPISCKM